MLKSLTIATRESPLALWQAHHIKSELKGLYPELEVCLLGMTSRGDQLLDVPLNKVGGKGLFVMEFLDNIANILETALGHESVFEAAAAGIFCFFIGTWRIIRHPRQSWQNGLWNTYKQAWKESREKQELKKAKLQAKDT